ncbi:hypothetical protein [Cellulomonas sp. URHD0024]|uniref:hypothetical protein n=1 Tax=Cellulomonas sp. URHD0024 TaxID=1302620 RepID=UPI000402DFE1|nr:hypothetical protein [Cellulomonas sp. URHD0024]
MSADPFLSLVSEALVCAGRELEIDADLMAIDIASRDPEIGSVLGVLRPVARAVTFYVMHPTLVAPTEYPEVSALVLRATSDLLDAALEIDFSTGSVAYRSPVLLGDLELDAESLGQLLVASVEAVEATAARYRDLMDAVIAGQLAPDVAAARARRAPLDELQAQVDGIESR